MSDLYEIRIGVIGSVDSGKSTITGVLSKDVLDDGRGSARSLVMRHPHEIKTGRTSSIVAHHIQMDPARDTTFVDLAGHEKYLKTTINGIHRCQIDYAMVIIGANMGVLRMTEEHLTLSLSLAIPTIIIITKIDIAPANVLARTLDYLAKFIRRKTGGARRLIHMNSIDDYSTVCNDNKNIPVFQVSSVVGTGIPLLKDYIRGLPLTRDWGILRESPRANFIIDSTYHIKGIGIVVSGVLVEGIIRIGDIIMLGPIFHDFHMVQVKSIHNNYQASVDALYAGQSGCFAIKFVGKSSIYVHRRNIKRGCRLMTEPKTYTEFEAIVRILHHPSTIRPNYEPTVHCGPICQTAKLVEIFDKDCIRLGDTAKVRFRFKYRPEFIEPDMKLVFREGSTKGIGKITHVLAN
jgi:GTPase